MYHLSHIIPCVDRAAIILIYCVNPKNCKEITLGEIYLEGLKSTSECVSWNSYYNLLRTAVFFTFYLINSIIVTNDQVLLICRQQQQQQQTRTIYPKIFIQQCI